MTALDRIRDRIDQVKRLNLHRQLRHRGESEGMLVRLGDRVLVNVSSNDYLGLANEPSLKAAATAAIEQWGTGSGASRLVTGSLMLHRELEQDIAVWKQTADALLFNSGYQANIGVLAGLMKAGDRLFVDALSHASIRDGASLSRATHHEFRHNDLEHLETLLADHSSRGVRAIVTESVFSMDGDLAPLSRLLALADAHDCLLVVDEAHGVGVFGERGAGLCAREGLHSERLVQVGTCGKALGSFGAYVAATADIIDLLRNRARSFIYTTSLPPAAIAATMAAIAFLQQHPNRQQQLARNCQYLATALGLELASQICPIILGDAATVMAASTELQAAGFWLQAIRPPTVPQGTARLRLSLSALHTPAQLDRLCETLSPWLQQSRQLGIASLTP